MRFLKSVVQYLLIVLMLSIACYLMHLPVDVGQICGFTLAMLALGSWLATFISVALIDAVKGILKIADVAIKTRLEVDDEDST